MDALMAALVVAALSMVGERPAWLAARLADQTRRAGTVIVAALVALAPKLTPEAKLLMLAVSLILQGGGVLGRVKAPDISDRAQGFAGMSLLLFTMVLFGGLPFVVLTLAARTPLPWLAAVGGTVGALATLAVAATLGEGGWLALPLRPARLAVSLGLLLVGAVLALQALRLV